MTALSTPPGESIEALHRALAERAGRLPDDLVARCRDLLAVGGAEEVRRVLGQPERPAAAASPAGDEQAGEEAYGFVPTWADVIDVGRARRTGGRVPGGGDDAAAVRSLSEGCSARALWGTWRVPAEQADGMPVRVHLVEVAPEADVVAVTARVQAAVRGAGYEQPRVEVYRTGADLPDYQRNARASGALLWSASADQPVRIARLYDTVDPVKGPALHPDHPLAEPDELQRLVGYLLTGRPLVETTARMPDVVDARQGRVVPANLRTDGQWIWPDGSFYYLARYRLLPDPELVAHIRVMDYRMPEVDGAGYHRAAMALRDAAEEEVLWLA